MFSVQYYSFVYFLFLWCWTECALLLLLILDRTMVVITFLLTTFMCRRYNGIGTHKHKLP